MQRVNWKSPRITLFSSALFLAMGSVAPVVVEAQQPTRVTVFEGATPPHPSRTPHSLLKTAGSPPSIGDVLESRSAACRRNMSGPYI